MKISLVTTLYNEEKTITSFLNGLINQSQFPDEVIIVDGGSTDNTLSVISNFTTRALPSSPMALGSLPVAKGRKFQNSKGMKMPLLTVVTKKGNRSIGRNEGVKIAKGDIIVLTDAGCILDRDWVKEIVKPFVNSEVDVVAGYYAAKPDTLFQKCLVPYALVMPDKVDPHNFLPATRSMAIRKKVFEEMKGFDVRYSHNEDYVFARKLRAQGKKIAFASSAIVYWIPRQTFKDAYVMFWRFAYGDAEAGILRSKVVLLFSRYLVGLSLLVIMFITRSQILLGLLIVGFCVYLIWAILKNYRYVREKRAFYLLPAIQFTADAAVLIGSIQGAVKKYGI